MDPTTPLNLEIPVTQQIALKNNIKHIKTAVLWKKLHSTYEPDYCANRLNDNPWIVQPFENYELLSIEDIKKIHSKS